MAFLKFFKTKKGKLQKKLEKGGKKKIEGLAKAPPTPKPHLRPSGTVGQAKRKRIVAGFRVLQSPQITEKATNLQSINQYVFKVTGSSTKPEIKKAVEEIYGVDVLKVRTIQVPRRRRRLGRDVGWKKGYKKAVVTLKKGQAIEILPR